MHELAFRIEKSGLTFIWVINNRPLVEEKSGSDIIPPGFETRVSDRVGGFVSLRLEFRDLGTRIRTRIGSEMNKFGQVRHCFFLFLVAIWSLAGMCRSYIAAYAQIFSFPSFSLYLGCGDLRSEIWCCIRLMLKKRCSDGGNDGGWVVAKIVVLIGMVVLWW
ncbi:hypothetical protein G4B88_021522 [Cannabis sativa]|uniref:Transmembrane protein n=1 Tax=Cannabis sativa TaxID=3483 RepID=A0A7J6H0R7_CANSA|nr:hypothetical protein G4B88_021522 [Cannabis sativa]